MAKWENRPIFDKGDTSSFMGFFPASHVSELWGCMFSGDGLVVVHHPGCQWKVKGL